MSAPRRSSRASTPVSAISPPPSSKKLAAPVSARKSGRAASPAMAVARPALPKYARNTLLTKDGQAIPAGTKLHKVKLQVLQLPPLDGAERKSGPASTITIARVKCVTPKGTPGHIIKRFDTQAVSASSLFRAAFPTATSAEEITEMDWIANGSRGKYGDTKAAGVEGDDSRRLSGTWIPASHALELAKEYGIARYAIDLIGFSHQTTTDAIEIGDSEADSPIAARTTTKRQRVASPSAVAAASATIAQVAAEAEIQQSKEMVASMKAAAGASSSAPAVAVAAISKKRVIATVVTEEDYPIVVAPAVVAPVADRRGFFGKLFRRAPKRVPIIKPAAAAAAGAQVAVMEEDEDEEESGITPDGRRWMAGFGLAVAVGATAAVPYLLG